MGANHPAGLEFLQEKGGQGWGCRVKEPVQMGARARQESGSDQGWIQQAVPGHCSTSKLSFADRALGFCRCSQGRVFLLCFF